jgi:predicted Zn-dependent protease
MAGRTGVAGGASAPDLVEHALAVAALPCVAVVHENTEANLRWAGNALTTNGEMSSRTMTVLVTAEVAGGQAVGTVSRAVTTIDEVADVVAAAEAAAHAGPPSPDAAPPVPDRPGRSGEPAWDDPAAGTSIEVLGDFAAGLGRAFRVAEQVGVHLYGFAEHVLTTTYLGSSTGLRRRAEQPTGRLELNAKDAPETGRRGSAWLGRATRTFTDVEVDSLLEELRMRLDWGATTVELPPGRYETLLPATAVADLMIYAYWTANAQDAEEGRNVFAAPGGGTTIGNRLSKLPLDLRSDPGYPGLECVPFVATPASPDGTNWAFDVGLPVEPVAWLAGGVHAELIRNRARATATGREVTAPPDNLILDGDGTASLNQMIAGTERGLLLTCLWYIREVDPERLLLTGLTRDGVYLIEDGRVVGAVNNFRFNESPIELLGRITEVGATEKVLCREWSDYFNRTAMPPIRVPDFHMSTVSPAS